MSDSKFSVGQSLHHKRLPKFEPFDEVRLKVVPRLKQSGLSGDEWRTNVGVQLMFKSEVIHEQPLGGNMETAVLLLGHLLVGSACPIPDRVLELEQLKCDQPGCSNDATLQVTILEQFSDRGEPFDSSARSMQSAATARARTAMRTTPTA